MSRVNVAEMLRTSHSAIRRLHVRFGCQGLRRFSEIKLDTDATLLTMSVNAKYYIYVYMYILFNLQTYISLYNSSSVQLGMSMHGLIQEHAERSNHYRTRVLGYA